MAVTYVQLVNELLRRLNEVSLDTAGDGFSSVKGVHALAKDAINNSIREVIQTNQEWPFTLTTYTETMVVGTGSYSFQSDMSSVDWESFYMKRLSSAGNQPHKLPVMSYADYLRDHRPVDDTAGTGNYTVPSRVYKTQEDSFGVTPLPDDVYEVEYKYFTFASDLSLYTDTTVIPDRFRYVIIDGAMMYMMRFRSNDQQGEIHKAKFDKGIKDMRRILLDEPDYVGSTVINRGNVALGYTRVSS
tara:strand:+ start:88 stop:819 length:732 start_codon:yes stop_codon:yes gene_type:complete